MTDELVDRVERAWRRLQLPMVWLAARRMIRSVVKVRVKR
jgi:hypothetical protein